MRLPCQQAGLPQSSMWDFSSHCVSGVWLQVFRATSLKISFSPVFRLSFILSFFLTRLLVHSRSHSHSFSFHTRSHTQARTFVPSYSLSPSPGQWTLLSPEDEFTNRSGMSCYAEAKRFCCRCTNINFRPAAFSSCSSLYFSFLLFFFYIYIYFSMFRSFFFFSLPIISLDRRKLSRSEPYRSTRRVSSETILPYERRRIDRRERL